MKKVITMLMSAAALTTANAELAINENLSVQGFIDMSYTNWSQDVGGFDESDNSFDVDQVEIDFIFSYDKVFAQVDIEAKSIVAGSSTVNVEQAFAGYQVNDNLSIISGRYLSALGLEANEPTGLYQYSNSYDAHGTLGFFSPIPAYNNGIKLTYSAETVTVLVSLQDAVWNGDGRLGGDDTSDWGAETALIFTPSEELTLFAGFAYEDGTNFTGDYDTWLGNVYVTYSTGSLTLGAEVAYLENSQDVVFPVPGTVDTEGLFLTFMANYGFTEQVGVTGRVSFVDVDGAADFVKYTISPSYAWSDNLLTVFEISYVDGDFGAAGTDGDLMLFAIEQLFSF